MECVRDEIKAWVLSRHDRVALYGVSVKLLGCYVLRTCACVSGCGGAVGVRALVVLVPVEARGRSV